MVKIIESVLPSILMFSNIFMAFELFDRFIAPKFQNKFVKYIFRFNIAFVIVMFFEMFRRMFINN